MGIGDRYLAQVDAPSAPRIGSIGDRYFAKNDPPSPARVSVGDRYFAKNATSPNKSVSSSSMDRQVTQRIGDRVIGTTSAQRPSPLSAAASHPQWAAFEQKMANEGLNATAIKAFKHNFGMLASGANLTIGESQIRPVAALPRYDELPNDDKLEPTLLKHTVMLKLNGGIGTGMGLLDRAASLLPVKHDLTFLDLIAKQVMHTRSSTGASFGFMLMNSYATSADTLAHLSRCHGRLLAANALDQSVPLEVMQSKAPKVDVVTFAPVEWPEQPEHEWCPPGHGDLYASLVGSGTLDALLAKGYKYMFVSNADNLGATMDLKLLTWFAKSGAPFAMECAARTDADRAGGHLARDAVSGGLLLREAAQCPPADAPADAPAFQNVHKYFNTNNVWLDLVALKNAYSKHDGVLPLPVIRHARTVDPRDEISTKVLTLETAIGAAIECFDGAQAIVIPRSRFAPVKTTGDLLALMSDAYMVKSDFRVELQPSRRGVPPDVVLDDRYKCVDALLGELVPSGPPSLVRCTRLQVEGDVTFDGGVVFVGAVRVVNTSPERKTLMAGTYSHTTVDLSATPRPVNTEPPPMGFRHDPTGGYIRLPVPDEDDEETHLCVRRL